MQLFMGFWGFYPQENGSHSSTYGINIAFSERGVNTSGFVLKGQSSRVRQLISSLECYPPRSTSHFAPTTTMFRTVFLRALPRLGRPAVCHYSAAAIPVPNTQPEVRFNKVSETTAPQLAYCDINKCVFSASTCIKKKTCDLMQNFVDVCIFSYFIAVLQLFHKLESRPKSS